MTVSASAFNVPFEELADRTAAAMVTTTLLTTNGAVWTKPANAAWVEIVLVGKGGNGAVAGGTAGGGGGGGGEIVSIRVPASFLPAALTVNGLTGSESVLTGTGFELRAFAGNNGIPGSGITGGAGGPGGVGDGGYGAAGGQGGAPSVAGILGKNGIGGGAGGAGGPAGAGVPYAGVGLGYGGGGGGLNGGGASNGGGGGGGGGYGTTALATNNTGAQGVAAITTHRSI
jgi:hypothetical protein